DFHVTGVQTCALPIFFRQRTHARQADPFPLGNRLISIVILRETPECILLATIQNHVSPHSTRKEASVPSSPRNGQEARYMISRESQFLPCQSPFIIDQLHTVAVG